MLLPTDTGARSPGDLLLTGSTGFLATELLAQLLEGTDRRMWAPVRAGRGLFAAGLVSAGRVRAGESLVGRRSPEIPLGE